MSTRLHLPAIHHITAIAPSVSANLWFYEIVLGLRLVKQTVNFDDPYTYHLYYGDAQGAPGTILTFFPWQNLPQGRLGSGMVTAVAFAVPKASLNFWEQRLAGFGFQGFVSTRFGEQVLQLNDPHGLPLELVAAEKPLVSSYWQEGPIPFDSAITGFHSATATLSAIETIGSLLSQTLGMTFQNREANRFRFAMAETTAPGHFYDVVVDKKAPAGRQGSGTVHHIAFRAGDDAEQKTWQSLLGQAGIPVTDIRDRSYFRSIYFPTPGGVLFEIATDPPGFQLDESLSDLGASLKLPPQYEPMRTHIEQELPPLRAPSFDVPFRKRPPGKQAAG
jgi:glyoxalase family protein